MCFSNDYESSSSELNASDSNMIGVPDSLGGSDSDVFSDAADHLQAQSSRPTPYPDVDDDDDEDTSEKRNQQPPYQVISHYPNGIFMQSVSDSSFDHSRTPPQAGVGFGTPAEQSPLGGGAGGERQQSLEDMETPRHSRVSEVNRCPSETTPSFGNSKGNRMNDVGCGSCSANPDGATVGAFAYAVADVPVAPSPKKHALLSSLVPQSHENEHDRGNDANKGVPTLEDPCTEFKHVQHSSGSPVRRRRSLPESFMPSPEAKRHRGVGLEVPNEPASGDANDLEAIGSSNVRMLIACLLSKQTKGDASVDCPGSSIHPQDEQLKQEEVPATSKLVACLKDLITNLRSGVSVSDRKRGCHDILEIAARKGIDLQYAPRWHRPGGYPPEDI